jgi:stearoyl-CoA desaturase (Delta-9 desaturase)
VNIDEAAVQRAAGRSWRAIYFNKGSIPFWGVHLLAIVGVAMLGFSWWGLGAALFFYYARMFFVTGVYHRYFSHRTYKTSRWFQFLLALGTTTTVQKGALWWAAHHRHHHKHSDLPSDLHSPVTNSFWWSHLGWILAHDFNATEHDTIKDFARYPELRWLDRYWWVPQIFTISAVYLLGGWTGIVWVVGVSTVMLWHGTFTINSLSHVFGRRRYDTSDDSRNNWVLALVTMGEGWHNNHHHYQTSCRQGFRWYEVDATYYILRAMAAVGLVWDIKEPPVHIVEDRPKEARVRLQQAAEPVAERLRQAA